MNLMVLFQRLSIVGLLFSVFIVFAFDMLFQGIFASAILIYAFISLTYIIQAKYSNIQEEKITSEVATIVLGAVLLMIIITALFKLVIALNLKLY